MQKHQLSLQIATGTGILYLMLLIVPSVLPFCSTPGGMSCTVRVRTGTSHLAGTSSGIYITLYGREGSSGEHRLSGGFSNGARDTTSFTSNYITALNRITIRHDGRGALAGWQLDWFEVECQDAGIYVHIGCGCWLDGVTKSFNTGTEKNCPGRSSITNGQISCTGGYAGGSVCTSSCQADNYLRQGPECATCQYSQQWTVSDGSVTCPELCHFRRSHCYPGHCTGPPQQQLTSTCVCQQGFKLTSNNGALCDLDTTPDLSTCRVGVKDSPGTNTNSTFTGNSTRCQNQRDEGINTVPAQLYVALKAGLNVTLTDRQPYVTNDAKVGVIGLLVAVVKRTFTGVEETLIPEAGLPGLTPFNLAADSRHPVTGGIEMDFERDVQLPASLTLQDGDSVCADMKAVGGGFYNVSDYSGVYQRTVEFTPTFTPRRICFIYDVTKPLHCTDQASPSKASCSFQPLTLSTRLTRHPEVDVTVGGWVDPRPPGGETNEKSASGVDRFQLEVHEMKAENGRVVMEHGAVTELTQTWTVSSYSYPSGAAPSTVTARLPQIDDARLYALVLEVHDKVGNVRYARRLVLLDNSSSVETMPHSSITVIHANPRSHNLWQTDVSLPLCVNWIDHYYNTELRSNNFLLPVAPADSSLQILDHYEQITGVLPVNGTNNVMGVTKFEMAWSVDNSSKSAYTEIDDVFNQTTCLTRQLQDGETYDVFIKAYDIMNNTKEDSVRVSIDHTGPEVSVQGLRGRWDTDGLYVHNSTDLSTMRLVLTARDPHSGLATIHWTLGTGPLASVVGDGAQGVQRLGNVTSCTGSSDTDCYCPAVGPCENSRYVITFNSLVDKDADQGNHHREYFLTLAVTNAASLTTAVTLDVLLDESPPTQGVVWEGLDGQAEMDFTSSSVLHVRWRGFQDHESGVRLFRAVLAQRCLNVSEVEAAENASIVQYPVTLTSFVIPREGHYNVSVVAYNGALGPSTAACSDGVVYDTTPPAIVNVSLAHARSGLMVGCTQQGEAWLVNSNLTRVALSNVTQCSRACSLPSSGPDVQHLPLSSTSPLDQQLSDRHCRHLPVFSDDSYIVLPSDYVRVAWQGRDAESDLEEYYVGMGRDRTTSSAPDLLPFTPTHGHPSYHARHAGLSHGDVFFVFLQAASKAGLVTRLTLGPVLIDVTAPDVTRPLTTEVEGSYLTVSWSGDVFVDTEQPKGVDLTFSFRVGYDGGFLTPILELPETSLTQCRRDNVTGCARYPVAALYDYDTQQGRSFFFQLHVTNAAGHVAFVNTSSVRLPSHFPPSHAVVMDVLKTLVPEVANETTSDSTATINQTDETSPTPTEVPVLVPRFSGDVDVIFQRQEVCSAWNGFYHQEEVSIEAGLGMSPGKDDVIGFQPATNKSYFCFDLTSPPVVTRLFSVVRATSSGGTTIFSSDGFVMVPYNDSSNAVKVFNGPGCHDKDFVAGQIVNSTTPVLALSHAVNTPLHPGDFLFIQLSPFVPNATFPNSILLQTTLKGYQVVVGTPNATLSLPVSALTQDVSVQILRCQKDSSLLPLPADNLAVAWEIRGPWQRWIQSFKVEVVDKICQQNSAKKGKYSQQECRLHQSVIGGRERELRVPTKNLFDEHMYVTSLRPCFDDGCVPPVVSDPVTFIHVSSLTLSLSKAVLFSMGESELEVGVVAALEEVRGTEVFQLMKSQPCVLQWVVSRSSSTALAITDWTLERLDNCSAFEVNSRAAYNGDGKGSLYVCLRLLYPWRTAGSECSKLQRPASSNQFLPFQLVELDETTFRQTDFQPLLHSLQLGTNLQRLFDLDLDFAPSDVMLSAALTNGEGRNVTWFLMTSRRVPAQGDCAVDPDCVTSMISATGYVTFSRHRARLQHNALYFICAVTSENAPEESPMKAAPAAVQVCGDGVVIDDAPPVAGSVAIGNADSAYLGNRGYVVVTWSGFADVEKDVPSLPDEVTLHYSVALGSFPGGEDVTRFEQAGQRTSWTFQHLHPPSGTTLYASVRAEDRVGHVTEVWSRPVTVDSTPPTVERVTVGGVTDDNFISGRTLTVHWEGVEDGESGIHTIEVGVAQEGGGDNVIGFQPCDGTSATVTDSSALVDGHAYVALLQVSNKAGLTTLGISEPFIIDRTPPSPGRVWHSGFNTSSPSGYSTRVGVLSVEWAGFADPHSGLQYYRVGLGTTPGDTDVLPFVYLGLRTAHTWTEVLNLGTKYYSTVQTCNRAGLCRVTSSSSVTLDNSPPTAGHVTVGLYGRHDKYLGHNTSVPVQWTGFSDPQTGIQRFTWCVGTQPRVCDVAAPAYTVLSSAAHGAGLALPVATPLYVTVRASNPAGLETVSVSESFQVDLTPPDVLIKPHFRSPRDGGDIVGQWDRSVLHVAWRFRDPESSVVTHTVYVRSRLTGKLVVEPVVLGPEDELTLTLDEASLLADGDSHWTSVTACNAAHLCVTAASDVISVDSTPPVAGTFLSPLRWARGPSNVSGDVVTTIDVAWRGFSDSESEVVLYRLLVGRDYNGHELSGGRVEVTHDPASVTQRYSLEMREEPRSGEQLHLALLAENSLGLAGSLVRTAFRCLSDANATSGSLVLVRHSCEASYCSNECTCAAAGKVCTDNTSECVALDSARPELAEFSVLPFMGPPADPQGTADPGGPQSRKYSTSTKCLEGHWSLSHPASFANVSRFQASFGYAGMAAGEGVFRPPEEPVWLDLGRHTTVVHCLAGNRTLTAGQSYVMHVRAWLSRDTFLNFTSPPMVLDNTPPLVRRGRSVVESDASCLVKDFDYVSKKDHDVTACWEGVFQDGQSPVVKYQVWMGTSAVASDHIGLTDVGLNTSWTFPTRPLEQGTRYHVTVRAWNEAGLQATAVSDGFVVDVTSPVPGVVFNTGRHGNAAAQSSTDCISASWHGFEDRHSGVTSYLVAVYDVDNATVPVRTFSDVGVKGSVGVGNVTLQHTHRYKIAVKAKDAAGLESPIAESAAILVDVTPPEGVTCTNFRLREAAYLSPESPASSSPLHDRYVTDLTFSASESGELVRVEVGAAGLSPFASGFLRVAQLKMPLRFRFSPSREARAQLDFLYPDSGALSVRVVVEAPTGARIAARLYECSGTVVSPDLAVTVHQTSSASVAVCARIRDRESGLKTTMVGLGTTEGGLQVAPWTAVDYGGHVIFPALVQHASPLYATVVSQNRAGLWSRFSSQSIVFDDTPPLVSNVTLTLRYDGEGLDRGTEVWAESRWTAEDRESGVEICTCRTAGRATVEPAEQSVYAGVTDWRCQWQLRHAHHGSEIEVTVSCVNNVQLLSTVTSRPVAVLLRPPDVNQVLFTSLSNNALMSPFQSSPPLVRSDNSSLQFFWRGVEDPSVTAVYFRFLHQSRPLSEWSPLPLYKTAAVLNLQQGKSGVVVAELKVANERLMTSEVVSASALLDDVRPLLTGQKATLSVDGNKQILLDWSRVFHVTRDVTFSVFAGTQPGYGDVINHVVTSATRFEGFSAVVATSAVTVSIQAVYDNGLNTRYEDSLMA